MSRFIDKLNQVSRAVSRSVGFRAAPAVSSPPKILLIASLAQAGADRVADYVAGADAWLLDISKSGSKAKTLQQMSQAVPDIPWGGWLKGGGQEEIKPLVKSGCDFVVFPAVNTSLAVFQDDEVGKVLEIKSSLSEGMVGAVNELPVDAVFLTGAPEEDYFLTWHHLMLFQRCADLLAKPLLVSVPSGVTAGELQSLWGAGIHGVVIEVDVRQPPGRLNELRRIVDELVFPSPRKRGKAEALLPYIGRVASAVAGEEEEEES